MSWNMIGVFFSLQDSDGFALPVLHETSKSSGLCSYCPGAGGRGGWGGQHVHLNTIATLR